MRTLEDVLLYLARHVPAHPQVLADMERVITGFAAPDGPPPEPDRPPAEHG